AIEEGIRRPVPLEGLRRDQALEVVAGVTFAREFRACLVRRPPLHEGLGLGEEVGEQRGMVRAQRVLAARRREEVTRDQLRALVDELVEGVLAVGTGLAPDHRPRLPRDALAGAGHALAVALHVAL